MTAEFNDVLKCFLAELSALFPEEAPIAEFAAGLDALIAATPTMPRTLFRESIGDHAGMIAAHDEAVFIGLDFGGIDLGRLWTADLTPGTRKAIWDYLNVLMQLAGVSGIEAGSEVGGVEAMALQAAMRCAEKMAVHGVDPGRLLEDVMRDVPEDVTRSIRALADQCSEKLGSGDVSMESVISDIMASINTMDLTGLENVDVTALTEAMGLSSLAGLLGDGGTDEDLLKLLDAPAPRDENAKNAKSAKNAKKNSRRKK